MLYFTLRAIPHLGTAAALVDAVLDEPSYVTLSFLYVLDDGCGSRWCGGRCECCGKEEGKGEVHCKMFVQGTAYLEYGNV
jgi:hypothetical protein